MAGVWQQQVCVVEGAGICELGEYTYTEEQVWLYKFYGGGDTGVMVLRRGAGV